MTPSAQTYSRNIETARLKLPGSWKGIAALQINGSTFQKNDWNISLRHPELLFENTEKILKTDGSNSVAVKNFTIAGSQFKVVVKRNYPTTNLRQIFRSLQPAKSFTNFQTALKLTNCQIPVVVPLAALYRRSNLLTKQSIYITEYCPNSTNVYAFAFEHFSKHSADNLALKKQLCRLLAETLASLHQNGFWHRDSKATNFIVCPDQQGKYKIFLTDLDGIKPYFLSRSNRRFSSLWRLAASLMSIEGINRTDYFRAFKIYCDITGLEPAKRKETFRQLVHLAETKHLLSTLKNRQ